MSAGTRRNVGDTQTISIDTRVIAASNRDLMNEVNEAGLRGCLAIKCHLREVHPARSPRRHPSTRDVFLNLTKLTIVTCPHLQRRLHRAQQYHWPGSMRELPNYVERHRDGPRDEFTINLLPPSVLGGPKPVKPRG